MFKVKIFERKNFILRNVQMFKTKKNTHITLKEADEEREKQ